MSAWGFVIHTLPFGRGPLGHMASTLAYSGNCLFVATKVLAGNRKTGNEFQK